MIKALHCLFAEATEEVLLMTARNIIAKNISNPETGDILAKAYFCNEFIENQLWENPGPIPERVPDAIKRSAPNEEDKDLNEKAMEYLY